jgi:hypothetical protein
MLLELALQEIAQRGKNPLKWIFEELKYQLTGLFKGIHYKLVGKRKEQMELWSDAKSKKNEKTDWRV